MLAKPRPGPALVYARSSSATAESPRKPRGADRHLLICWPPKKLDCGFRRLSKPAGSPTAVDTDRLAGHKGGLVRGEKSDHRRHLVGAAEAADRDGFGALGKPDFQIVAILPPVGADRPRGAD